MILRRGHFRQSGQMTLLEALPASIAAQLAVLDTSLIGTGRPAPDVRGVSGAELADSLTNHLMREIVFCGSRSGSLAPLADQLNHDLTHLQMPAGRKQARLAARRGPGRAGPGGQRLGGAEKTGTAGATAGVPGWPRGDARRDGHQAVGGG